MAKKLNSGVVYGAQDRLFDFLKDSWCCRPRVNSGRQYLCLFRKGDTPAPDLPAIKIAIINIAKWLDEEKPAIDFIEDYEEEVSDDYTDPDKEYSTELGQVPQAAEKGSIKP